MSATTIKQPLTVVHAWEDLGEKGGVHSWRRELDTPVGRRRHVEVHSQPTLVTATTPAGFVARGGEKGERFQTADEAKAFLDRWYA